jgi:hypothetical protein
VSKPHLKSLPENAVRVLVLTDGTETVAEVVATNRLGYWETVGLGTSKRRTWVTPHGRSKGDPRNEEIGVALAMSRAFKAAAEHYEKIAQDWLGKEE